MYRHRGETKPWTPIVSRTEDYHSSGRTQDNMSPELRKALHELRDTVTNKVIRISSADEGGAVMAQDTNDCVSEASRQLQDEPHYTKLKKDPTIQIAKTSNEVVNRLHDERHIDDLTCR